MIAVLALLFFAAGNQLTLDRVRAESNPEHRAKAAVEYAAIAERAAEQAVGDGDDAAFKKNIADMVTAMELARDSFVASGKTPSRNPRNFKKSELKAHELLHRLGDLKESLDLDKRALLDAPIKKIEAIHDVWFYGIMGKKK
ncbi:MAG TPA: hypothetical protein VFT60_03665 [Bryobacteraceae bacterium]|jgi:hypothetical protein|nr:hypothetical protein [Bryobacteraceae bacterium]